MMVEAVVSDLGARRGARVLPFVNGMGGTPLLELYLLYGEIERGCARPAWSRSATWSAATSPRWRWRARR